jgi:hypothetical protein
MADDGSPAVSGDGSPEAALPKCEFGGKRGPKGKGKGKGKGRSGSRSKTPKGRSGSRSKTPKGRSGSRSKTPKGRSDSKCPDSDLDRVAPKVVHGVVQGRGNLTKVHRPHPKKFDNPSQAYHYAHNVVYKCANPRRARKLLYRFVWNGATKSAGPGGLKKKDLLLRTDTGAIVSLSRHKQGNKSYKKNEEFLDHIYQDPNPSASRKARNASVNRNRFKSPRRRAGSNSSGRSNSSGSGRGGSKVPKAKAPKRAGSSKAPKRAGSGSSGRGKAKAPKAKAPKRAGSGSGKAKPKRAGSGSGRGKAKAPKRAPSTDSVRRSDRLASKSKK